jgi:hypothetical protein
VIPNKTSQQNIHPRRSASRVLDLVVSTHGKQRRNKAALAVAGMEYKIHSTKRNGHAAARTCPYFVPHYLLASHQLPALPQLGGAFYPAVVAANRSSTGSFDLQQHLPNQYIGKRVQLFRRGCLFSRC